MGKMSKRETTDPELEKILSKAFEDIQRRVVNLIVRREKKLVKALSQKPRKEKKGDRQDREDRQEQPDRPEKQKKRKEPERSRSVSEESD